MLILQDLDLEKKFKSDFQALIQELKNKEKAYRLGNEAYRAKLEVLYNFLDLILYLDIKIIYQFYRSMMK